MAADDYNIIKPVASLQNIGGLTPVKQRKDKNPRQNVPEQNKEEDEQQGNEPTQSDTDSGAPRKDASGHSIDYCA
jgi:hypothetical protein